MRIADSWILIAAALASFSVLTGAAARDARTGDCHAERAECQLPATIDNAPTIRDQIRNRRDRLARPRLDRPSLSEPRYGAPGFGVINPGGMIGR